MDRLKGVEGGQDTVAAGIDGDSQDGDVFGEGGVRDKNFDYADVRDGGDGAVADESDQELVFSDLLISA